MLQNTDSETCRELKEKMRASNVDETWHYNQEQDTKLFFFPESTQMTRTGRAHPTREQRGCTDIAPRSSCCKQTAHTFPGLGCTKQAQTFNQESWLIWHCPQQTGNPRLSMQLTDANHLRQLWQGNTGSHPQGRIQLKKPEQLLFHFFKRKGVCVYRHTPMCTQPFKKNGFQEPGCIQIK